MLGIVPYVNLVTPRCRLGYDFPEAGRHQGTDGTHIDYRVGPARIQANDKGESE